MTTLDTVIIGGGQAGLALGHHLRRAGRRFVILDSADRVGDSWRGRWDSLTLFTPRRYDSLPGLLFPGDPEGCPGKDEVADYLETYAKHFDLPLRLASPVASVRRDGPGGLTVETSRRTFEARQVVIATGGFTGPAVPDVASRLDPRVAQLHSSAYRNPSSVPGQDVLVVGAGNTGVQIAQELAVAGRRVTLSVSTLGKAVPELPVLDGAGAPIHAHGITDVPGLAFLGLPWQRSRGSALLGFVGRDAGILAGRLGDQLRPATPSRTCQPVGAGK